MKRGLIALLLLVVAAGTAGAATISGTNTEKHPAAIAFNDVLYVFYHKPYSSYLSYRTTTNDGATWSAEQSLPLGNAPDEPPAAIVYNNELFVFYPDVGGTIRYRELSSSGAWSAEMAIVSSTDDAPGLAVFNDRLYVFWETKGSNDRIRYGYIESNGFSYGPYIVPFGLTRRTPAAHTYNNRLYIAYAGIYGSFSQALYYGYMDVSGSWYGEWQPTDNPRLDNYLSPRLEVKDDLLWMFYPHGYIYEKRLNSLGQWSAQQYTGMTGADIDTAADVDQLWILDGGSPIRYVIYP